MMWFIIALMRKLSVPGRCWMWMSARRAIQVLRGSQTIRLAPRRSAFFISRPTIGCASVGFAPMRNSVWTFLISPMELVMAPEPKAAARPATVGAWQVVAHWSTLFVPPAARASFCVR